MSQVSDNISHISSSISSSALSSGRSAEDICLVAVSKRHSIDKILEAYDSGHRDFGENYVDELLEKAGELHGRCPGIQWHFIGRVQSNKLKKMAGIVSWIHGISSETHIRALDRLDGRKPRFLVQVNLAGESQKGGVSREDLPELLSFAGDLGQRPHGLMLIPPAVVDPSAYFEGLATLQSENRTFFEGAELSMGMSADFEAAIRYGATMVRVGTAIFGARGV